MLVIAHALGWGDGAKAVEALPSLCVFHRVTGFDCPGCGMTRAFICLLRGDWQGAFAVHPFSLPLFISLILFAVLPNSRIQRFERYTKPLSWLVLTLVLVWWIFAKISPRFF